MLSNSSRSAKSFKLWECPILKSGTSLSSKKSNSDCLPRRKFVPGYHLDKVVHRNSQIGQEIWYEGIHELLEILVHLQASPITLLASTFGTQFAFEYWRLLRSISNAPTYGIDNIFISLLQQVPPIRINGSPLKGFHNVVHVITPHDSTFQIALVAIFEHAAIII